jgi:hypothetical protein
MLLVTLDGSVKVLRHVIPHLTCYYLCCSSPLLQTAIRTSSSTIYNTGVTYAPFKTTSMDVYCKRMPGRKKTVIPLHVNAMQGTTSAVGTPLVLL